MTCCATKNHSVNWNRFNITCRVVEQGRRFEAFVIPKKCPTFRKIEPLRRAGELEPNEEVTFGGTVRKTGIKRGPNRGIQPKK